MPSTDVPRTTSVVAEEATVVPVPRVSGQVRIDLRTETVEDLVNATLTRTDVSVTRHELGRVLDPGEAMPSVRTEGEVTIIPILEDRLIVEVRPCLVAELHVTATTLAEEVETPVSLRRQHAEVTRTSGPDPVSDLPPTDPLKTDP